MNIKLYLFGLLLLSNSLLAKNQDAKVILGIEFGRSSISLDADFRASDYDSKHDGYLAGYIIGYRFDNDIVIEGNRSYSSNDGFFRTFDHYETTESRLMLGYSFEIAERFRIVPMLGYTRWKLTSKEGRLLNPGSEEELEFTGTDLNYKVRADLPVGRLLVLSLSYTNSNVDYGRNALMQVGVMIEF